MTINKASWAMITLVFTMAFVMNLVVIFTGVATLLTAVLVVGNVSGMVYMGRLYRDGKVV